LSPLTARLSTVSESARKNGSAIPQPVSGFSSAHFCAHVESPARYTVRPDRLRSLAGAAVGAAARAIGMAASAAAACRRVTDMAGVLSAGRRRQEGLAYPERH